jgi:hypothetical protein
MASSSQVGLGTGGFHIRPRPEDTEKRLKLPSTSPEVPPEVLLSIVPYSWNALSTLKIPINTPKMYTPCHNMGYEFISV